VSDKGILNEAAMMAAYQMEQNCLVG
jgi:hypothetical protein